MEQPIPNQPTSPNQSVSPEEPQTPLQPQVHSFSLPNGKKHFDMRYIVILFIIIGIGGGIAIATHKPPEIAPTPTPTIAPTPTPITRITVPLANDPAYHNFADGISSLSASLKNIQVTDTTLSPPVIELPLGFPN